jgi:hypothetical protein
VERTGVHASSREEATPTVVTETGKSRTAPPEIVLRSSGGQQEAVAGSFCSSYTEPATGEGEGVCGDSGPVHPDAVTVAQRGDEVTLVFRGAEIVRPDGCHGDDDQGCIGFIHVRPLGCENREVDRVPLALGPETAWRIDLASGAYELDVFGYFESSDGATGDVSGSLGLLVGGGPKENDYLGVTGIKRAMQVCPFSD